MTTLAYFSIDANGDGTLDQSGPGWNGYQSQDLADLVTRAHAAGDRVVLTITCFSQSALNQITSDPNAPARLSAAVIAAVEGKNLDGVNFDFEGEGSADQAGLTNLITKVSAAMHATDPHWQVTMAVYGSAASDPGGFYNVAAVAPAVDAFFVMAYDMNSKTQPSPTSPLFGAGYTDARVIDDFLKLVPPSKIILGLPYYGYDWPTTGGTIPATATGPESPVSYATIAAANHPTYWDPVTDTPWTSYQVGSQWYTTYFDDPTSMALKAAAGELLPHRRCRDLGARYGRQRPGHDGRATRQRPGHQGHPHRTTTGHRFPDRRHIRRSPQRGPRPDRPPASGRHVTADRLPRWDRDHRSRAGMSVERAAGAGVVVHQHARGLRGDRGDTDRLRSGHWSFPIPAPTASSIPALSAGPTTTTSLPSTSTTTSTAPPATTEPTTTTSTTTTSTTTTTTPPP